MDNGILLENNGVFMENNGIFMENNGISIGQWDTNGFTQRCHQTGWKIFH
jgi:hypothetical protein